MAIAISKGFTNEERPVVARLFWQAFGAKLGKVLGPDASAYAFLEPNLDPEFALVARGEAGELLGLAGFKTRDGGLIDAGFSDLSAVYGVFGALWRALLLSVLERKLQADVFQMDGIFVRDTARGQGIGSLLLGAVIDEARARNLSEVQLDVIDTNPRARALYERVGFRPLSTETTGPFRYVFGFRSATRMRFDLTG